MPRILIADDHPLVRGRLRQILEVETGFAVCAEAATGLEAIRYTAAELPDVVILDLAMPELNGLEAARRIHQLFPAIHLLIMTMYDSHELLEEAITAGVRTCIIKTDLHRVPSIVHTMWQSRQTSGTTPPSDSLSTGDAAGVPNAEDMPGTILSGVEREVLLMLARGKTSKDIAATLRLTSHAVELHRREVMRKLGISSTFELVRYAVREKFVHPR